MSAQQPKINATLNPAKPVPKWSSSLSVGNAKLDEQHITLLELGRDLMRLLETKASAKIQIHAVLEEIVKLAHSHDALEEKILESNACPTLLEHKAVHLAARNQLANVLSDVEHGVVDKALLNHLIADWMAHHISENDLPVKNYLKSVPRARSAS